MARLEKEAVGLSWDSNAYSQVLHLQIKYAIE